MRNFPEIHNIDNTVMILQARDEELSDNILEVTVMNYPVIKGSVFEITEEQLIWELRNGMSIYD